MRIEQNGWYLEVSELDTRGENFALFIGIGQTDARASGWRVSAYATQKIMETCARALANQREREALEAEVDDAKK